MKKEEILNYVPKYYHCNRCQLWHECNEEKRPLKDFIFKSNKHKVIIPGVFYTKLQRDLFCNVEVELKIEGNKVFCEIIWKQILRLDKEAKIYGLTKYSPIGERDISDIKEHVQLYFYKEYLFDEVVSFNESDNVIIISIPLGKTKQIDFGWKQGDCVTNVDCHNCIYNSLCDFLKNAYSTSKTSKEYKIIFPETAKIDFKFTVVHNDIKRQRDLEKELYYANRKIFELEKVIEGLGELDKDYIERKI